MSAMPNTAAPGRASPAIPTGVVVATVAGNALEFYDFGVYAYFAAYIAKAFFPNKDDFTSLLTTVAVFGVGFVFRPLGGIVIGAFADRAGRRAAMLLTIALITVGTMALALTPSYASIGVAAPIIVIVCRVIQGFGLGGEVGPATAFLVEAAPPEKRAFYASWQLASQGLAASAGGLLGVLLSVILPAEQLGSWGWRVPFLLGLTLIPIAIYLRQAMPETLEMGEPEADDGPRGLGGHAGYIVLAILIILAGTVSTYVGQYMTTYAIKTLKLPSTIALSATLVFGVTTFVASLLGGWLADRYNRKSAMLIPRVAIAIVAWPAFWLLSTYPGPATLYFNVTLLAALTAISGAASLVVLPELLPRGVRASGFAIAYALGVSIFGGSTQFIITWLIGASGDPTSPAWYVTLTSLITIGAMLAIPETKGRALRG